MARVSEFFLQRIQIKKNYIFPFVLMRRGGGGEGGGAARVSELFFTKTPNQKKIKMG